MAARVVSRILPLCATDRRERGRGAAMDMPQWFELSARARLHDLEHEEIPRAIREGQVARELRPVRRARPHRLGVMLARLVRRPSARGGELVAGGESAQ